MKKRSVYLATSRSTIKMIFLRFQMILTIRGHLFKTSVGGVFGKHALDTISFPGSRESFRSKTRMASEPLRRLQCRSIT